MINIHQQIIILKQWDKLDDISRAQHKLSNSEIYNQVQELQKRWGDDAVNQLKEIVEMGEEHIEAYHNAYLKDGPQKELTKTIEQHNNFHIRAFSYS